MSDEAAKTLRGEEILPVSPGPGLYKKFEVRRTDGRSGPGQKHEFCDYLVLDWVHDPFAIPAGRAYADACEKTHPELATDIRDRIARALIDATPIGG